MASYIFKPFPRLKRWSSRQCPVNCSAISSSLLWQRGSRNFANCRGSRSLQQSATVQPLHPLSAAPALGLAPAYRPAPLLIPAPPRPRGWESSTPPCFPTPPTPLSAPAASPPSSLAPVSWLRTSAPPVLPLPR